MLDKVQVVEIGMPRTASRSMAQAMKVLGYTVSHGTGFMKIKIRKYDNDILSDCISKVLEGNIDLYPYDKYEFVGNLPAIHWKQLAEENPNLKFILTNRDENDWYVRCQKKWFRNSRHRIRVMSKDLSVQGERLFGMIVRFKLFGCYGINEFYWRNGFRNHREEVIKYFEGTDRLLVHDVFDGDGWDKLCEFLGKEIPDIEYPNTLSQLVTSKKSSI